MRREPLDGLAELALYGSVAASTAALAACLERGVPVAFHSASGRLLGVVSAGLASNVQLRIAQHEVARDEAAALRLAREFVRGKLRNQRTLLRRNSDLSEDQRAQLAGLLRAVEDAPDRAALYEVLLTPRERVLLEGQVGRLINHEEDQVLLIELGPADQPPRLEIKALGQCYQPQRRENLIL